MNIQKIAIATVLTASATIALNSIEPAFAFNIVENGSFEETTTIKDGGWATFDTIKGWSATEGGKIEVQRGAAGKPYDGKQLVELDSHSYNKQAPVLGIFQDLVTQVGQLYTVSFAYSARPGTAAVENVFSVLFGDGFKQTIKAGEGGKQTDWNIFSVDVLASSDLTRLQFNYEGPRDTYGAYIDDVKVSTSSAVPEPTTMAGLALAGMGIAARKKFKANRQAKAIG
jgi:hypothetical protein